MSCAGSCGARSSRAAPSGSRRPGSERFAERTIEMMAGAYPELAAQRETILRWIGDEEESFGRTLDRGTELLARLVTEAKERGRRGSRPRTRSASTTPTASRTT